MRNRAHGHGVHEAVSGACGLQFGSQVLSAMESHKGDLNFIQVSFATLWRKKSEAVKSGGGRAVPAGVQERRHGGLGFGSSGTDGEFSVYTSSLKE